MITKKKLAKWLNVAALAVIAAGTVVGWVLSSLATSEKAVVTGAIVVALLAKVPGIKRDVAKAIAESDLPEDEVAK
ncbi:MAG: hypothetical protein QG550_861 [Pseudomonadota bacterium]|nr:hypothetical protein [Pseudomonadota bacterium]